MRKGGLEPPRFYPPDPKLCVLFIIANVYADKTKHLDMLYCLLHILSAMGLKKRGTTWHTQFKFNGQLIQRSLRTKDKNEAKRLESILRAELVRGEFGVIDARRSPTLAQFEDRLLQHLKANCAPRTLQFYSENLAVLLKYKPMASCRISSIDAAMVENFTQWRLRQNVAKATCNHSLRTLRRALHLAYKWRLIREVPSITLLPDENQRDAVITETMLSDMLKYIGAAYPGSLMLHLLPALVDTGLRISEACGLLREHVTFDANTLLPISIRVVKGKSKYARRRIPLTDRAATAINECCKRSKCEYVFTGEGNKRGLTRHYPSQIFREAVEGLNLGNLVLHSTRHTFCSRLAAKGCSAAVIQHLAGHSSIAISQRYIHDDDAANESAVALLNDLGTKKPVGDKVVIQI